jgi:hypothetical protein
MCRGNAGFVVLALLTAAALVTPALANDFDLITGDVSFENGYTTQALALRNNTGEAVPIVYAECGFYSGNKLLGGGTAAFARIEPNQTAYGDASIKGKADRIDCRVWRP